MRDERTIIDTWPTSRPPMSDHLVREIAAAARRGRPLGPGEPVPGCSCPTCTGIPADSPARVPAWKRRNPRRATQSERERREAWESRVDAARRVSIAHVAVLVGCGDPVKRGREYVVRCPLHEDSDPSCRLDLAAGLWYCDPCAEGGDAIAMYMKARRVSFADAVRELAA